MIETALTADPATIRGFDEVIDVRTPAEFAEDHVPGAVNLPVLNDAERAEIGTIYVQQSKFLARRMGAALVSRNIADHLLGPLAGKGGGYHPLIYCWRGGQRSSAMATVMSQVGWRVGLLQGGYRTYRRHVTATLYDAQSPLSVVLLTGGTGSGKTVMLGLLAKRGVQTLDLEALAVHRGSLFGAYGPTAQPSQKMFESRLLAAMERLDPALPTVVEAESSRIGNLFIPPTLWTAMSEARFLEMHVPAAARARHVVETCRDIAEDAPALMAALTKLPRHHSGEVRSAWASMAREERIEELALQLIEAHYDPAYRRSGERPPERKIGDLHLAGLTEGEQERAADQAAILLGRL